MSGFKPPKAYIVLILLAFAVIQTITTSSLVLAHDISQIVNPLDTVASRKAEAKLAEVDTDVSTKAAALAIYRGLKIWNTPQLTVCFGPHEAVQNRHDLVQKIEQISSEWTDHTGVTLDFGSPVRECADSSSAKIRVDVKDPGSQGEIFASLIGNEAAYQSLENYEPYSMLLLFHDGSPAASSDDEMRFYVLHEFGHALGADHEHQRVDCKWNWDFIAQNFFHGDLIQAHYNLDPVFSTPQVPFPGVTLAHDGLVSGPLDNNSAMKYNWSTKPYPTGDDPRVYTDGTSDKCYRAGWISHLSQFDRDGVKVAYANANNLATSTYALLSNSESATISAKLGQHLSDPRLGRSQQLVSQSVNTADASNVASLSPPLETALKSVQSSPKAATALSEALVFRNDVETAPYEILNALLVKTKICALDAVLANDCSSFKRCNERYDDLTKWARDPEAYATMLSSHIGASRQNCECVRAMVTRVTKVKWEDLRLAIGRSDDCPLPK